MSILPLALSACTALGFGCAIEPNRIPNRSDDDALLGPFDGRFQVPGVERSFLIHLPPPRDDGAALPLVIALHGGGGNATSAFTLACPNGDTSDDRCLSKLADREGFVVVAPEGTPARVLSNHRTWNAGGGDSEHRCVSGRACADNVDDVAFFDALLAEVQRGVKIDARRIFVTGMSNGAAMAHRLACERSKVVAAIGPVGGGNQVQTVQGCTPERAVPVLAIHGTQDPCWHFGAKDPMGKCEARLGSLPHFSIEQTLESWRVRNGCNAVASETEVKDQDGNDDDDGLRSVRVSFGGCRGGADVELVRVEGGGHSWPLGNPYLGEGIIGKTTTDFSANELLWSFFAAHPLP